MAHRYVAMTVPKVACTTIKMALQTWEGCGPRPERWADVHAGWAGPTLLAYPTAQIVEMLRSPDYLRFSFVRNPYSRLVSAWKSKLAWDDPQYQRLRVSIREACGHPVADGQRAGPVSFRDAVQYLLDDPGAFDDHWNRQTDLLMADVIDYDVIGRFERFGEQFHAILGRLAVEHRHDQSKCLGFGEDDRRQPRPAPEPVPAIRTPGRLDGDARLSEDPDIPARGPLRDTQPRGEFAGRRAAVSLEDLEGTQSSCGGAEIGRHTGRLGGHEMNRKQIVRNWS
jgi:hypothetical protein